MNNSMKRVYAIGRLKTGEMNNLEKDYYDNYLMPKLHSGELLHVAFEATKLRLADKTFYSPDFTVLTKEGELQHHECKGFMMEDANIKIKVAAATHPYRFFLIRKQAKKLGGGFSIEEV